MKKFLSLLLSLILILTMLPLPARATTAHNLNSGIHFYARDDFFTTNCSHCGALTLPAVYGYPGGNVPLNDYEWGVLTLTNVMRHYAGLAPVTAYSSIQQACDIRAEEVQEYFSHTRPNGTRCFTVFDELGIPWFAVGENIAQGHRSPKHVTAGWMNSAGHRENMLTPGFEHMGVGYYASSWVQLFTDGDGYTRFNLVAPGNLTVEEGTAISTLGIYATLNSPRYGECYLPILDEYCTGYNSGIPGTQTVTVSVLGYTASFTITVNVTQQDPCANGHTTELRGATEATCESTGYTGDTYCTVCETLIQQGTVIPKADHRYTSTVTPPTCTDQGYTTHICTCGDRKIDSYTDPSDHTWDNGKVTTEPTVEAEGVKTFTCTTCGDTTTQSIPKLDPPPVTEPPATEPPTTEPPATEPPATEPPVTEPPATEPPATEPPATEPPATEPPATEPPATEPPATEPPATEPPATEPPTTEPPATEPPATEPPATEPPVTEPPAPELPSITGSYTTDILFPAADLGVNATDSVLRATFTFTADGRATTTWKAMDLTALRLYFRDMFVNAYYACAYGAGITDIREIERFCQDSTGLSVSAYMDTIVTPAAIEAAFTPANTAGTYRYNDAHTAIYTDMAIMAVPSDPNVPNPFTLEGRTLSLNAASYGKPDYTFLCTRK